MTLPLISVLLPVFNAAEYLSEAIESILSQTYSNFEFIIIDDGSTDRSLDIIKDYKEKDRRILLFSRENRGLISTLNEGIGYCSGKYIARMDADDISYPDRFNRQISYLSNHPECVAVGTIVQLIDAEGAPLMKMVKYENHEEIDGEHLRGLVSAMVHPASMYYKSAAKSINGYSVQYPHAEDFDFWLKIAEIGKLANVPEVLLDYRQHIDSVGYRYRSQQIDSIIGAVKEAHARRGLKFESSRIPKEDIQTEKIWQVHLKWAWWALQGGNIATARKHARKSILLAPHKSQTWRALACALRGY